MKEKLNTVGNKKEKEAGIKEPRKKKLNREWTGMEGWKLGTSIGLCLTAGCSDCMQLTTLGAPQKTPASRLEMLLKRGRLTGAVVRMRV
jgi:hypothetical protein